MKVLAENRKAYHEYVVLDKFVSGIALIGSEVKAVREGKVDFEGSFVKIISGAPVVLNLYIGKYSKQGREADQEDPRRNRKLLLKAYEIERLGKKAEQKGFSVVPLKIISEHGLIKVELGLVKGKKAFDKKEDLKRKQELMDLARERKDIGDARF